MTSPSGRGGLPAPVVAASEYDTEYYTTCCAGAHEWQHSGGRDLAGIYKWALGQVKLVPGDTVVDVGSGRGEFVALAEEHGAGWAVGVEYSEAAVALSQQTFAARGTSKAVAVLADARQLPLPDHCVDVVTMLDVVEHLSPAELKAALIEARRCLRPTGRLFIHTFPTSTVYDVTYRLQRNLLPWRRATWPANPRTDAEQAMHVNEQTPGRLARTLRAAGFTPSTVSLGEWVYTDFVPNDGSRRTFQRLARHRLTARFGISNLWALALPTAPPLPTGTTS